jgi:hypothetical protein
VKTREDILKNLFEHQKEGIITIDELETEMLNLMESIYDTGFGDGIDAITYGREYQYSRAK